MDDTSRSEKSTPTPNVVKRYARKIYNPLGFKKAYNFVFFFILAGALLGFSLYNIRIPDVDGYWIKKAAAPGEEYSFSIPRYNLVSQHGTDCLRSKHFTACTKAMQAERRLP